MSSSRGMIRSMLLIGSAKAVNILISLVRMKLLAVMTGPVGIGVFGIYSSLQSTVGTLAGLGLGSSGVRELASAKGDMAVMSRVRRVLFAANLIQGLIAMALIWTFRAPLAHWLFGAEMHVTETGLVGVAVALSLVSASQTALLQGLRRVADLGRVTVISSLAGTFVGLAAVWLQGDAGLIWFLIAQPATAVVVALWFTRRLPKAEPWAATPAMVWQVWKPMAALGAVFMLSGLATAATLLLVRGLVARDLGLEAAGFFAASWAISMTYIGFLLSAMSVDYYPRLVGVLGEPARAVGMMNDQMQIGLALGGPILLVMIGLGPWMMTLLYSPEFAAAAPMLQWQMLGNVLKLAAWPLSFVLVAAARSWIFLCFELGWNLLFLGLVWFGLPRFGLEVAGAGFALVYLPYFLMLWWVVGSFFGFRFDRLSIRLLLVHCALASALLALAFYAPLSAAVTGIVLGLASGLTGLRIVLIKIGPEGRLATRMTAFFAAIGWPVRRET